MLLAHPIDWRGRCRSCRRSGAVLGLRRRPCRVYIDAGFYLLASGELLRTHLVCELGLTGLLHREPEGSPEHGSPTCAAPAAGQGDIDVLPRITTDPDERSRSTSQAPVVPSPLPPHSSPRTGRPEPDHGGPGERPDRPRPRRGPPSDSPPDGLRLMIAGAVCASSRTSPANPAPPPPAALTPPPPASSPAHCSDGPVEARSSAPVACRYGSR